MQTVSFFPLVIRISDDHKPALENDQDDYRAYHQVW
jgi:hypothetical protein